MLRVVYMGTPGFATIPLDALAADPRYQVVGVVTQPDRPARRSSAPEPPPVKLAAQRLGLPVFQPETLRSEEAVAQLAALRPDVGVVAAYGELLRRNVLAIPRLGYLNIHPSLLPRWRGPTPTTGTILAGDAEAGVSVMLLDTKMDSGPILAQHREPLAADARAGDLTEAMFHVGARLLLDALDAYASGALAPQPQDDTLATYTKLLTRADGQIDWGGDAAQIERMTRAYDPWPGTFTAWRGQQLRILAARVAERPAQAAPGQIVASRAAVAVACGQGALELLTVQPAGKRPMAALDWARGQRDLDGAAFGA